MRTTGAQLSLCSWFVAVLAGVALIAPTAFAQSMRQVPSGQLVSGTLSFDGHATAGDFVGKTTEVSGQVRGASELNAVSGWVEAPVKTLKTGNDRRDRDLNKSMESEKYPVLRFELARVAPKGGSPDSLAVTLHGSLSIHGVTREVELPARVQFTSSDARVRTSFPVNLKDYRIGGLSKMLGMLKMYEDIEVHADLLFRLAELRQ
jgi:polyisoprenoid-binding protein YceI